MFYKHNLNYIIMLFYIDLYSSLIIIFYFLFTVIYSVLLINYFNFLAYLQFILILLNYTFNL